jgi:predicted DNA binding protein
VTINKKDYSQNKILDLVHNPSTSSEVLDELARDKENDECIKTFIARHSNTTSKTLVYLLKYDRVEMMGAIAENSNTSPEILELMVRSSDKLYTLYKLAQNPNTPSDALDELFEESDSEEVKLAIAQNPSTATSTLKNLFNESDLISIEARKNYDNKHA